MTVLEEEHTAKFAAFVKKIAFCVHYRYDEYEVKLQLLVYNMESSIEEVAEIMDEQRITLNTEGG